jgi:hypothetical protein
MFVPDSPIMDGDAEPCRVMLLILGQLAGKASPAGLSN